MPRKYYHWLGYLICHDEKGNMSMLLDGVSHERLDVKRHRIPYQCPFCGDKSILTEGSYAYHQVFLSTSPYSSSGRQLTVHEIMCTNTDCEDISYTFCIVDYFASTQRFTEFFQISYPRDNDAKKFPSYVPEEIKTDYEEAWLICDLSPRASATLARRCLQGIIRDYWKVSRQNLHQEIVAIKSKISSPLYDSLMAIKSLGNIGAHPELNTSLIIDVEPNEARALLLLIERLITIWYIARAEEEALIEHVKKIGDRKQALKDTVSSPS